MTIFLVFHDMAYVVLKALKAAMRTKIMTSKYYLVNVVISMMVSNRGLAVMHSTTPTNMVLSSRPNAGHW